MELESFISKFHQLWRAGESAKLDLETHAGHAWVGLRVQLGQASPHSVNFPSQQKTRTRNSPARERRRARRLAERQAENAVENVVIANINVNDAEIAENIEIDNVAEVATENAPTEEVGEKLLKHREKETTLGVTLSDTDAVDTNPVEFVDIANCPSDGYNDQAKETTDELEIVHATAKFEDSPFREFQQDDIRALEKFICSEDHLTRNIANIEIDLKVNLEAHVKLHVRKKNLWESPKSYIWKFLGGDNHWARQNGTKIRMRRIHVK